MRTRSHRRALWVGATLLMLQGGTLWGRASLNLSSGVAGLTDDGTLLYSYAQAEAALSGNLPRAGHAHFTLSVRGQGTYYFYDMNHPDRYHPYAEGQLSEGLLRIRYRSFILEGGTKLILWSEMIGPSLVDITNPRDLRDPAQLVKSDRPLASPLVYASFTNAILGTTEAYFSPEPAVPRMPYLLNGYPVEQPQPMSNYEGGVRWGRLFWGLDLKLLSVLHRSRIPQLVLVTDKDGTHWTAGWPLMHTSGGTASYAFDYIVLRGEATSSAPYSDPDPVMRTYPTTKTNQATLAADFTYGDLLIGLQGQAIQPEQQIVGIAVPENWAGSYLQYHFTPLANTEVSFNGLYYRRTNTNDVFHREALQLALGDHTRFSLAWESFIADKEPIFLLLQKENRVMGDITLMF